ncbi:hypothetical protein ElyMa_001941300 [Elysia marginata]|uniref:Uncharacterized protein n=1 Tax=Elysia marginata TaxID=1093978 RepID=A0AAV4EX84_9GAST|nr:hypothetical protein ElyMa_001941300 [Elysia marginata]
MRLGYIYPRTKCDSMSCKHPSSPVTNSVQCRSPQPNWLVFVLECKRCDPLRHFATWPVYQCYPILQDSWTPQICNSSQKTWNLLWFSTVMRTCIQKILHNSGCRVTAWKIIFIVLTFRTWHPLVFTCLDPKNAI